MKGCCKPLFWGNQKNTNMKPTWKWNGEELHQFVYYQNKSKGTGSVGSESAAVKRQRILRPGYGHAYGYAHAPKRSGSAALLMALTKIILSINLFILGFRPIVQIVRYGTYIFVHIVPTVQGTLVHTVHTCSVLQTCSSSCIGKCLKMWRKCVK